MKILVRDDAGNEYDAVAPDGASIAYAVEQASKKLGFKVRHVETPPVPEDLESIKAALKHAEHMLEMETRSRSRAEDAIERETKRREDAEDELIQARSEVDAARERQLEAEAARSQASSRAGAAESSLS